MALEQSQSRTRLEDYIDDKFQTAADLDSIQSLLSRVEQQRLLLQDQLKEAQDTLSTLSHRAAQNYEALQEETEQFILHQEEIDQRLMSITHSEVSDIARKKFESRLTKIHRLETAASYLILFREVNTIITEIQKVLPTDSPKSLELFLQLRSLQKNLHEAQPAAEGAAPHLIDWVDLQSSRSHDQVKIRFEDDYKKILEKMNWPKKDLNEHDSVVKLLIDQTYLLLSFQEPYLVEDHHNRRENEQGDVPILLPFLLMVEPLAVRFQYHFYGDKPTNRLDKPQYYFAHVLDLLDQHADVISRLFQPTLEAQIEEDDLPENLYTDAISSFITALLPMLEAKCLSVLPEVVRQPQLLSHFIHELMNFDDTLRETWQYQPVRGTFQDWRGVTWMVLNKHGYFDKWLAVEKEFALTRFKSIRDAEDSNQIDYDSTGQTETKPTKGAIRVNDLLETVTDRYRALSSFSQKMKFLLDIQLFIFDDYHGHLYGGLQAYLAMSHTAGRYLQGQSETDAFGQKGLESLLKIFGSSDFLERKMADWSDDVFFLELWDELQDRAQTSGEKQPSIGVGLVLDEVASKTSSRIKSNNEQAEESDSGALFDETAASFRKLRERSEAEISRSVDVIVQKALQPFQASATWATLSGPVGQEANIPTSASLNGLLDTIRSLLGLFRGVLARAPLLRVSKHMSQTIQKGVLEGLILHRNFSAAGAQQLQQDVSAIQSTIDSSLNESSFSRRNMGRLAEALFLLNLAIKPTTQSKAGEAVDGWDFDEAQDDNGANFDDHNHLSRSESQKDLGLWEVERLLFESNESARSVLADLGLRQLNESDARKVLKQRVELKA